MSGAHAVTGDRASAGAQHDEPRARICFVVSSRMTVEAFLTDQIRALSEHYEVHLALNAAAGSMQHPALNDATLHQVGIERSISPLRDVRAVLQLVRLLRAQRFAAVHSVTPKAGLLAALAAFLSRVPVRVHTYTGQVWATRKGAARTLLKALDRVIARLDTHVLVDSASQRDFLRAQGVLAANQGVVLGLGSVSGVDTARFRPDAAAREAIRRELSIPSSALTFLFLGRLNRDKGVLDLASAFERVARGSEGLFLVYVGPDEDALAADIRSRCGNAASRVRFVSWTESPERYMAACDVFCLPSYREGFGSVVIEAAAAGLPAIGSRIYGVVDAIENGTTGLLCGSGQVDELAAAMAMLAADDEKRAAMGQAARARALRDFSREILTSALVAFYERALPRTKGGSQQEPLRSRFD